MKVTDYETVRGACADELKILVDYAGLDALGPIKEDSTRKCLAALHSDMFHSKILNEQ